MVPLYTNITWKIESQILIKYDNDWGVNIDDFEQNDYEGREEGINYSQYDEGNGDDQFDLSQQLSDPESSEEQQKKKRRKKNEMILYNEIKMADKAKKNSEKAAQKELKKNRSLSPNRKRRKIKMKNLLRFTMMAKNMEL